MTYGHFTFLTEHAFITLPADYALDFPLAVPVQDHIERHSRLDKGELCEFASIVDS